LLFARLTCRSFFHNPVIGPLSRRDVKPSLKSPWGYPSPLLKAPIPPLKTKLTTIEPSTDFVESMFSPNSIAVFKTSLPHYGRSIIESALEHTVEESHVLEKNIITSRDKVIAHYTAVSNQLKRAEIRQESTIKSKNAENAELKKKVEEQRNKIESSEKQSATQLSAKLRLLNSLRVEERKVKDLEAELATIRKDRKRKREDIVEVFERVEKVKVDE